MALNTENAIADAASAANVPTSHPVGFWFFFWGEFAERCSFYGMKTILPVYLTAILAHDRCDGAGTIMNWFKMGCYALPLLGGFLADRFFGKYWTIVGFSIPYVLGHFILGIPTNGALYCAAVAGRRQRRDQAEHLHPDGADLRSKTPRAGAVAGIGLSCGSISRSISAP